MKNNLVYMLPTMSMTAAFFAFVITLPEEAKWTAPTVFAVVALFVSIWIVAFWSVRLLAPAEDSYERLLERQAELAVKASEQSSLRVTLDDMLPQLESDEIMTWSSGSLSSSSPRPTLAKIRYDRRAHQWVSRRVATNLRSQKEE